MQYPNLIMACITGSQLYGTNRPDSDVDIRGICFQPKESIIGLTGFEQYQPSGSEAESYSSEEFGIVSDDVTIYGVSKFIKLALNNNPNIIELLFVPNSHLLKTSNTWQLITDKRYELVCTKLIHTFAGYAYSQLQRIQKHHKWLHNPPSKPDPFKFGMFHTEEGGQHWEDATMKQAYQNQLNDYQHYETWRNERNPKRAALEAKFGFDTKHAAHLYRLSLEAQELLITGHLTLPLPKESKERVLLVLDGYVSYEEIVAEGERLHDMLKDLESTSVLPKKPNIKVVEELLMAINMATLLN